MARLARAEVFDPSEIAIAHVINRTVRRCFLLGDDPVSGNNYDHRQEWIEKYLRQLAACFGIDLLGFAILSNHFHLILRSRPDVVQSWDDTEVARRWLTLCPHRRTPDGKPSPPTESELNSIRRCPVRLAEIRGRLSNISWWMRLLCQRVAQRANREDEQTGRFFQDRFRAVRLLDEESLLACAAYVDLNPIRAAMAETLESSDHTSVQRRIEAMGEHPADEDVDRQSPESSECLEFPASLRADRLADAFLSPLTINEAADPIGPCPSVTGKRCSDKGFLPLPRVDYLELLDWTARQVVPGKRGSTAASVPPILRRLGLEASTWCELVSDFGRLFSAVAGHPRRVDAARSHRTQRRFHLTRRVRELMTPSD
jgi:REP element-mobilizing transposase RayT